MRTHEDLDAERRVGQQSTILDTCAFDGAYTTLVAPSHGSVQSLPNSVAGDQSLAYTSTAGYAGPDHFQVGCGQSISFPYLVDVAVTVAAAATSAAPTVTPTTTPVAAGGTLASTGAPIAAPTGLAAALLGIGSLMPVLARRLSRRH